MRSSRSIHSSVVNWLRHVRYSSRSNVASWIGRMFSIQNGLRFPFAVSSYSCRRSICAQMPPISRRSKSRRNRSGIWTNLWPKFFSSAQYLSSSETYRTCTLSMKVWVPLSLTIDWALLDSSGRTKFDEMVSLTTRSPASMATGSSVAQYLPSRYSSTKTGTLDPTFTFRTRSLRTTLPAKTDVAFWSNWGMGLQSFRYMDMATSMFSSLASSTPDEASRSTSVTVFCLISSA